MGAYRGAGRPEATALIERLVDHAARTLEIDPIELRIRNLLPDDSFPFQTLTGITYDSGRYSLPLRTAARAIDYEVVRAHQQSRRANGDRVVLGIGVAAYVEITAGGTASEFGAVEVHHDGTATIRCGTSAHGQGHRTSFSMIVSAQTGIPIERIRLVDNDTDLVRSGAGTGGSRSLQVGGSAVHRATEAMVAKARSLAAHLLEADSADIEVDTERGVLAVRGVPARSLSWGELAMASLDAPEGVLDHSDGTSGLAAQLDFDQTTGSFPFGAHISIVEVDLDTGEVRVVRHVAVDDCGTVINPLLVEGQQHGGIAAGIGQALYEHVRFDDDGNPLTATLMDYTIASAAELPSFETISTETPTPLNPLGAKGIGEAATIGATPAVQNAVIDALAHLGVRHIDMPCTPERIWAALRQAERFGPIDPWSEPASWVRQADALGDDLDPEGLRAAEGA
jgi:carbon-monoxide dehydrogenase large subunit